MSLRENVRLRKIKQINKYFFNINAGKKIFIVINVENYIEQY